MRVLLLAMIALVLALPVWGQDYLVFDGDPDFDRRADDGVPDWRARPTPRPADALHGLFEPDPVGILRMVRIGGATSTCVGRPVTALCAVETDLACFARFDAALCKVAWIDFDENGYFPGFAPRPGDFYLYRVADVRPLGVGYPGPGPWARDGDLVIDILWMRCGDQRTWCSDFTVPASYAVRQLGPDRWAIVWASKPFYIETRDAEVLAAIQSVRNDPDFFTIGPGLSVPLPDWQNRPTPRDARTLDGVFAPDPVGVLRMVGLNRATSRCIGEPTTAACAVETTIACLARDAQFLCEIADPNTPYDVSGLEPRIGEFSLYRFTAVRLAEPDRKMPEVRPGDVLMDVVEMRCSSEQSYCSSDVVPATFAVRGLADGVWAIVDVYAPRF